jgi:hypothetical protein
MDLDDEVHKVVALIYVQNDYLPEKVMKLDVLFVHDMILMDDRHKVRYSQMDEVDHVVESEKLYDFFQDLNMKESFEVVYDVVHVRVQEEE